jgi:hypothetical protein
MARKKLRLAPSLGIIISLTMVGCASPALGSSGGATTLQTPLAAATAAIPT